MYLIIAISAQVLTRTHSIEDDTGPKFMYEKHRDDLNDVNWYGGEWLEWMETRTSSSKDHRTVKNSRDYFLTVSASGEMKLPSPDTHGTGSNWASPIAQLIQIAWGEAAYKRYIKHRVCSLKGNIADRANGLKKQLVPKYKIFAANPEKYLDVTTYLPPPEMLQEDFVWVKPSNMPAQQLLAWATHLYARQQRKDNGEDIEVLAFHVVDKTRRPSKRQSSPRDPEPTAGVAMSIVPRKPSKVTTVGSGTLQVRADLSDDEPDGTRATLDKNIVFEPGSPGAAGNYWKQRIAFLKGLCRSPQYTKLVCWLQDHQVRKTYINAVLT